MLMFSLQLSVKMLLKPFSLASQAAEDCIPIPEQAPWLAGIPFRTGEHGARNLSG